MRSALVLLLAIASPCAAQPMPRSPGDLFQPPKMPTVSEIEGRGLAQWLLDLKHSDPGVREKALMTIPAFTGAAGNPEVITALLDRFSDHDAGVRDKVVGALG